MKGTNCWAIAHVPAKGPWPNPTWKMIGIILFIWFPILLGRIEIVILFVLGFGFVRKNATL